MTPASAIASLNRQLAEHGQSVTVRRYTAPSGTPRPKTDAATRAFVRPVKADQIVGAINHTFANIVLAPGDLAALLPLRKDDKILVDGRERNVEVVKPITMADVLVRIDVMVAG